MWIIAALASIWEFTIPVTCEEPLITVFASNWVLTSAAQPSVWSAEICEEPLITPSASNLVFTFESKLVIVSALTWDEPLITPSASNLVFTLVSV